MFCYNTRKRTKKAKKVQKQNNVNKKVQSPKNNLLCLLQRLFHFGHIFDKKKWKKYLFLSVTIPKKRRKIKENKTIFLCLLQYLNLKENNRIFVFFVSVTIPENKQKIKKSSKNVYMSTKKSNVEKCSSSVYYKGFFILDIFSTKKNEKSIFFCLLQYLKKEQKLKKTKVSFSVSYST